MADEDWLDTTNKEPNYISFYTLHDGQGAPLRQTLFSRRHHIDKILYNQANKMAKELGAKSWLCFKAWGMPTNIYYDED